LNRINSVSFGRRINNTESADNKNKNHKRNVKIALAVGAAAITIGGIALYKNRNSKPVLKFRNFVKDGIMAPLKEKDVPLKKKVSNVWNNLKDGVKGLKNDKKSAAKNFEDIVDIKKPEEQVLVKDTVLSKNKENIERPIDKPLDGPVENPLEQAAKTDKPLKATGSIVKKPKKAAHAPSGGAARKKADAGEKKSPIGKIKEGIVETARNNAKDLKVAAGAAAIATGGVVAGGKINDAIQDSKEKDFSITLGDEEFKGELKNGAAFDENGKPLNGTLKIHYGSGKEVLIKYTDGVLQQSVIFGSKDSTIPKTIRVYDGDGRISKKHDKLRMNKAEKDGNAFISSVVRDYYPDCALKSETRYLDKLGKNSAVTHFSRNLDDEGKIKGKPIQAYSTKIKTYKNGTTLKSLYIPINGEDKLIRTSKRTKDDLVDITLFGLDGREVAQLSSDSNKKATLYRHIADGKDDGLIRIEDGKVAGIDGSLVMLSKPGDKIDRYMAKDESIVEISYKDGAIYSIASYANADENSMPETEMIFNNGGAHLDILYDKNGEIVFKVNH